GGNGTYTVGGVPGTVGASEDNLNCAGWTLGVVYQNFSLPVRNLTLFIGSEFSGNSATQVGPFCAGKPAGRLAVSAMEGDAPRTDDQMLFGPGPLSGGNLGSTNCSVTNANRLSGSNNPVCNFFASQINGDDGALVTSGTFGGACGSNTNCNANATTGDNVNPG